jgi:hypothetical protein
MSSVSVASAGATGMTLSETCASAASVPWLPAIRRLTS